MAFVIADRVKETTTSTGTTAITLAGAVTGYQTFSASIGNANTTYYTIADQSGANWEVGVGTYTSSGNTLSRNTVLASSNSGSLVTFTSGTKDVFVSAPAERFGPNWQTVQTGNFTASSNCAYPVNTTSAAITATLPASPKVNDIISFVDYAGTFATNNLTLSTNGNKVDGSATSSVTISTKRAYLNLLYVNSTQGWITISNIIPTLGSVLLSYLIVAGGGGSTADLGGGGGGGGYLDGSSFNAIRGVSITITVGAGGNQVTSGVAGSGSNSSLAQVGNTTITAIGGGGGGGRSAALNGGSGGGAPGYTNSTLIGLGTSGQGNNGGLGYLGAEYSGGGGGGAGAVGSNAQSLAGGNGGIGKSSSITGTATYYAGGGGGGLWGTGASTTNTPGQGGLGGGGNAVTTNVYGGNGTANTGGGGGGGFCAFGSAGIGGGNGGSGVVILAIPTSDYSGTYTGSPTVTTSGSNTILKFTSSGTYTV